MAFKKLKHITVICNDLYNEIGASAVYDYANKHIEKYPDGNVRYKHCTPCEAETPHWNDTCLICGN